MSNLFGRYEAPTLTVYGSMVKLTANGAGASCENGSGAPNGGGNCGGGTNQPIPTRRP